MKWEEFCYAECERQHATTDADIAGMETAWAYASVVAETINSIPLSVTNIQVMGFAVDPIANPDGRFRTGPAVFMDGGTACSAQHIDYQVRVLTENLSDMTPNEVYQQLMWIHPFRDGNGRVGALVYNVLNGTINDPIAPPEYK